nr:nucleosome assembly protein 1;2-like isoform X1 [Ipomoea batatas]
MKAEEPSGGRRKCCQSPKGFVAAARVGPAHCYFCSNSDFRIIFMIFLDSIQKRVKYLREIQTQHDELEAKFLEERAALEAK